jgi:hypothetical protein
MQEDRFVIENQLWMITTPIGVPIYDFGFRDFFDCRTPYDRDVKLPGVARVGAFENYSQFFSAAEADGIALLNTPTEQKRCSSLPGWYPLISGLTPRSRWFDAIPSFEEIADDFGLPVFVKGARQTSRHSAASSIIRTREDYTRVVDLFGKDSVLHWQKFVCRELLPLRRVPGDTGERVSPSFEFRTFWRRGELLAAGRYWHEILDYRWTDSERETALKLAATAAQRVDCGFLVIDLAMTADGRWVIIECNDAMESGYAGVSPFQLWRAVLDHV